MRIAMVVPGAGFVGGVERHAHDLAAGLRRRGHRLWLVHGPAEGRERERYIAPFERVVPVAEAGRLVGAVDVVYVHRAGRREELEPFGDLPMLLASHDHDLTCVRSHRYLPLTLKPCHRAPGRACVAHGCVVVRDRDDASRMPVRIASPFVLQRRLGPLAQRAPLVACSRYVRGQLVAAGVPADRALVVHPRPPEDDRPLVPRPRARRLLFVGQLLRGKGADIAIRALAHLPSDVTLTVAGDGPSADAWKRLAERVAPGRVDFVGWVPPHAIGTLYDEASVVVVPSRWPEPFGMVGIEAMRRGRPVVAADHGGIPEWLPPSTGGRAFTPGDPVSLAHHARAMLDAPETGAEALAHVRSRFPFEGMVDEVESLLDRVAGEARIGGAA